MDKVNSRLVFGGALNGGNWREKKNLTLLYVPFKSGSHVSDPALSVPS